MKPISEHISELLYSYDCVTVPSLGAFVAGRVSAMIDSKRGLMLPPRKEIIFNRALSYNDGLLVSHIAIAEGITFEEASKVVAREVSEMMRKLRRGNFVMLSNIGTLTLVDDELNFVADSSHNYLTDSYGFSPIVVVDYQKQVRTRDLLSTNNIRRVAVSAALVFGLLLFSPNVRDGQVESSQAGYSNLFESIVVQQSSIAELSKVEEQPQEIENLKYHIIVGSFISQIEADKFISSMNQKGIDGLEKIVNGKRVRVAAASFATHEEAVKHNRSVRTIKGFEKAWVWEN